MSLTEFRNEALTDFSVPANRSAMEAALTKVKSELGRDYPLRINGESISTSDKLKSLNPSRPSGVVGQFSKADQALAEKAMQSAVAAFATWSKVPAAERIAIVVKAAAIMRDRKVADGVRVMVVPGSQEVKKEAENEGLAEVFRASGAEWREAGCSMCIAMNGDQLDPGQYAVSTSNRNFEGRQGRGGRTFLASPLTAAAAAVTGRITDVRTLLEETSP